MPFDPPRISRRDFCKATAAALALKSTAFAGESSRLRVATFTCDVTTPLGQPIYSGYKPLAKVEHPLLAKGVVLDDGRRRYVLCAVDYCELCNSTHLMFRQKLAHAVGTDVSCVSVQAVHQHTAPMADADALRLLEKLDDPPPHLYPAFYDEASDRLAVAARRALANLHPCDRIGIGRAKVDRVASSRRVKREDGTIWIRWSSCTDPKLRAMPEGLIDPWLKTITFARGNKALVRLHYYATHPQSFYGDPRASYDVPGIARERLEAKENVPQIYFTGCAGDITMGKYNDRTPQARAELSDRLFAGMESAVASTTFAPVGPVTWRTYPLKMKLRTDPGYTPADYRAKMQNPKALSPARIHSMAWRTAFVNRIEQPIQLSSLRIGDVTIVHLPGEPMIEFQLYAQRIMPNRFVAVAGYGDGGCGYVCTEEAFEEGGYEPTASLVAPKSEAVVKKAIRHLIGVE